MFFSVKNDGVLQAQVDLNNTEGNPIVNSVTFSERSLIMQCNEFHKKQRRKKGKHSCVSSVGIPGIEDGVVPRVEL